MPEIDSSQIPKEKLVELCARSVYTLDGLWFILLEDRYGLDFALNIDIEVWRRFSLIHARRLLKTFPLQGDSPLQTITNLLEIDPFIQAWKPQIMPSDGKVLVRMDDCPTQKARIRDGRGEFPCKPVGLAVFNSYAQAVDPRVRLSCLVCPPDAHPPQYWCEWQFEI